MGVNRVEQGAGFSDLPPYDGTSRLYIGIDIGSKTIKVVVTDDGGTLRYTSYDRHLSDVPKTLAYVLRHAAEVCPDEPMMLGVTGSAGMSLASMLDVPFVQEVVACRQGIARIVPEADVAIEIGGEDSKILFLTSGEELRMNSTCAGGTGGFIDTLAGMLDCNAEELNFLANGCKEIHPIASRCAVFAQMDVRPLLNEGVSREDIAGSVFDAVAAQCITGLACGRPIRGKVALLGGPMHFLSSLRNRFQKRLGLTDDEVLVPENGHLLVAQGAAFEAALRSSKAFTVSQLIDIAESLEWESESDIRHLPALFDDIDDYHCFQERHALCKARRQDISSYEGRAFLGVDSGSEAVKYVLIAEDGSILQTGYERSAGHLVDVAREMLIKLYKRIPRKHDRTPAVTIAHATVTGYGEAYLKEAFSFDSGEVETVSHIRGAQELSPEVDFIVDIGGQDIKCVWLDDGRVRNVVLNEACSSGCGALVSGMAWSMNVHLKEFIEAAIESKAPVDLGTRCTVFMTSRVRHAQKCGVDAGDIAAGLAYSVVKNAIHKVIRVPDAEKLGDHIMVQGGTFANDAVLRAFEKTYGCEVMRPDISPYMGAFGAALIARDRGRAQEHSTLLDRKQMEGLTYSQRTVPCGKCGNECKLTITDFVNGEKRRRFVVGNRCSRGGGAQVEDAEDLPNMFEVRNELLFNRESLPKDKAPRGEIGIIRGLDTFETYPFWHTFFTELGFSVVLSDGNMGGNALETIPSESLCLPAKVTHGELADLLKRDISLIFMPNVDGISTEGDACPVIASYPEVLRNAAETLGAESVLIATPYIPVLFDEDGIAEDALLAVVDLLENLADCSGENEAWEAAKVAFKALADYRSELRDRNMEALDEIRDKGLLGVVVAGRPYHGDPRIHHGIPEMLLGCGYAVLTEDVACEEGNGKWLFPDRLIASARFASIYDDLDFVELTSFGCGLDAAASDEARDILEARGKMPVCLKIDEMSDTASARIRVRSMRAAREGLIGESGKEDDA